MALTFVVVFSVIAYGVGFIRGMDYAEKAREPKE
jgi:hypothetical protein